MKKITLVFFICLSVFGSSSDQNLSQIVDKIISINKQLYSIKDLNGSIKQSRYQSILDKKSELISKLTPLVSYTSNKIVLDKHVKQKLSHLKVRISLNQKEGFTNAVLRDRIGVLKLRSKSIFYESLKRLQALLQSSTDKKEITSAIEESLLSLESIKAPPLGKPSDVKGGDYVWTELMEDENDLKVHINSYHEILEYFYKNISSFSSSYGLFSIDLDYFVGFINGLIPMKNKYSINLGKMFFGFLIFIVAGILMRFLRKRKYVIFVVSLKKDCSEHIRKSIIHTTNRPLMALILVFALKLTVSLAYYPYIEPSVISAGFSIAFKGLFAWLIISISGGYGMAFIDTIVQDDGTFRKDVINLVLKIFYFVVVLIAFLLILGDFGINVSAIIASLGIGGLAVAWASKDILVNFFASILLLIDNSFSQGDWIACKDFEGIVVEIGLRHTSIRTFDNALLFIPNSILANEPIRNWTRRTVGRRIKMNIGLTYDSPKDKLEKCISDISAMLLAHPDIANPKDTNLKIKNHQESFKQHVVSMSDLKGYRSNLYVYLYEFAPSSMDILVYCFSKSTNWERWLQVKQDVMLKIIDIVEKHGLSFAFPSQSLYIEKDAKAEELQILSK